METPHRHAGTYVLTALLVIVLVWIAYLTGRLQTLEASVRSSESARGSPLQLTSPFGAASEIPGRPATTSPPPPNSAPPALALPAPRPAATNATTDAGAVTLLRIVRPPFSLRFETYGWDPDANRGYNFQVNSRTLRRTFVVAQVGDVIPDTGYSVTGFERKLTVVAPNLSSIPLDVSRLTLQNQRQEIMVLVRGTETTSPDLQAELACATAGQPQLRKRGETFSCADKTYLVVDVTPDSAIVKETASGVEQKLTLPAKP